MLHNFTLQAGVPFQVEKVGRYINVVLCAGNLRARLYASDGSKVLDTNLIMGMTPENLPQFSSVELEVETAQVVQIWIGNNPLTYAPSTSRAVGSNALRSSVSYVYSGYPHKLLDAEAGRNQITLTPSQDIYIGGTNLNVNNGIKLAAGQLFTMATQGAIYALELSGAYPPAFVPLVDIDTAVEDIQIHYTNREFAVWFENQDRTRGWGVKQVGASNVLYEYDIHTKEYLERSIVFTSSSGSSVDFDSFTQLEGDWIGCYSAHDVFNFNVDTGELLIRDARTAASTASISAYAVTDVHEYFCDGTGNVWRAEKLTGAWQLYASVPPFTSGSDFRVWGFAALNNGSIVWANENQLWYKKPDEEWTQGLKGSFVSGAGSLIKADQVNGHFYGRGSSGVLVSYDSGATWDYSFNPATHDDISYEREPQKIEVLNGFVVAVTIEWVAIRSAESGEWAHRGFEFSQRNCAGICFSPSGFVFFSQIPNSDGEMGIVSNLYGEPYPIGGLPVAVMEETN